MSPVTKRLSLYRNGDPSFKPVPYLYNSQKIKTFDKLLEELEQKCPPLRGGTVKNIYSIDGHEKILSPEQIIAKEKNEVALVVAGAEPYRPVKGGYENIGVPRKNRNLGENYDTASESFLEKNKRLRGALDRRSKDQRIENRSQPFQVKTMEKLLEDLERIAPPRDGGAARSLHTMDGEEITDIEDLENGQEYVLAGDTGFVEPKKGFLAANNNNAGRRHSSANETGKASPRNPPVQASPRSPRSPRADIKTPIFNRPDQVQKDNIYIFVFKNGEGLEAKRFVFTQKQLQRGMPWILEQMARPWGFNPKRVCAMDGSDIPSVWHFVQKGAYVIVPMSENFRNSTWYYLPENAKDTSLNSPDMQQIMQQRQAQGLKPSPRGSRRNSTGSYDSRTESRQNSPEEEEDEDEENENENEDEGDFSDDHDYLDTEDEDYSDKKSNKYRSPSRASTVSHADTMTLDGDADERLDDDELSIRQPPSRRHSALSHQHIGHTSHSHSGNDHHRTASALSYCSYCNMLEKHLEKHHGHSHAHAKLHLSPREAKSSDGRNSRDSRNSRSSAEKKKQQSKIKCSLNFSITHAVAKEISNACFTQESAH